MSPMDKAGEGLMQMGQAAQEALGLARQVLPQFYVLGEVAARVAALGIEVAAFEGQRTGKQLPSPETRQRLAAIRVELDQLTNKL